jgi:hypothetical protein
MSKNKTSQLKSKVTELLIIVSVMVVSMGAMLPAIQNSDRTPVAKRSTQKPRFQSLVSHRGFVPVRAASL